MRVNLSKPTTNSVKIEFSCTQKNCHTSSVHTLITVSAVVTSMQLVKVMFSSCVLPNSHGSQCPLYYEISESTSEHIYNLALRCKFVCRTVTVQTVWTKITVNINVKMASTCNRQFIGKLLNNNRSKRTRQERTELSKLSTWLQQTLTIRFFLILILKWHNNYNNNNVRLLRTKSQFPNFILKFFPTPDCSCPINWTDFMDCVTVFWFSYVQRNCFNSLGSFIFRFWQRALDKFCDCFLCFS